MTPSRRKTTEDRLPGKLRLHAAPATLLSLALVLALTVVGVIVLSGGRALASHVDCGEKITRDTRLDRDLVDCRNNGIVIGADNVTLNLNGHTIDGDGTPAAGCNPRRKFCDGGVVSVGHDGVAVRGGSVREFDVGVLVGNARRPHVLGVSSSGSRFSGIVIFNSARTLVRDGTVARNGLHTDQAGISLFHSPAGRFLHNSFRHNGDIGMFVEDSSRNRIEANLFSRNPEVGIEFAGEANRNEIRGNRFFRNGIGIAGGGNRNVIAQNRVSASRIGIDGGGNRNVIARNRVSASRAPRGGDGSGIGIFVAAGHQTVVARNVVTGSSEAGILVGLPAGLVRGGGPAAVDTVLRGNRLRRGNLDGVLVRKTALGTVLRRNRAHGSKDDGFDVESRTTTLIGNSAVRNADLGIEAARGVSDGGSNIARGNGDPRQCVNIVCTDWGAQHPALRMVSRSRDAPGDARAAFPARADKGSSDRFCSGTTRTVGSDFGQGRRFPLSSRSLPLRRASVSLIRSPVPPNRPAARPERARPDRS
jgi:parallel beta-helix repeat protein